MNELEQIVSRIRLRRRLFWLFAGSIAAFFTLTCYFLAIIFWASTNVESVNVSDWYNIAAASGLMISAPLVALSVYEAWAATRDERLLVEYCGKDAALAQEIAGLKKKYGLGK